MNTDGKGIFTTADLYLAAYLECAGMSVTSTDRNNPHRVQFIFNDTPKRQELVDKFFSGKARVDPLKYKGRIADLKSILYNS